MSKITSNTQIDTINILTEVNSANDTDLILLQRGLVSHKMKKQNLIIPISQIAPIGNNTVLGNVSGSSAEPSEITVDEDLSSVSGSHNQLASSKAIQEYIASNTYKTALFYYQSTGSTGIGPSLTKAPLNVTAYNDVSGSISRSGYDVVLNAGVYNIKANAAIGMDNNNYNNYVTGGLYISSNNTKLLDGCTLHNYHDFSQSTVYTWFMNGRITIGSQTTVSIKLLEVGSGGASFGNRINNNIGGINPTNVTLEITKIS